MNIKELLNLGVKTLGANDNALLECEVLLCHLLNMEKADLVRESNSEVDEETALLFNSYLKRLITGEPIAYLTKEKEFYGLNFYVDERVLIPRPETELLIDKTLEFLEQSGKDSLNILDLGTGSGNIAVTLARLLTDKEELNLNYVDAVDIDEGAIEVARINSQQHNVEDKVRIFQSDLMENIDKGAKYDVILANLPYIGKEKNRFVAKNVEDFEPEGALFGGEDGLELYEKLFQQIREKKIDYDLMMGEFGFAQGELMREMLSNYFEQSWAVIKDYSDIDRVFVIKNN